MNEDISSKIVDIQFVCSYVIQTKKLILKDHLPSIVFESVSHR